MKISSCFNLETEKNGFSFHINISDLTEEDVKALRERVKVVGVTTGSVLFAPSAIDFIELTAMYTVLVNNGTTDEALKGIREFFLLVAGQEMLKKIESNLD